MRLVLPLLAIAIASVGCRSDKPKAIEAVVAAPVNRPPAPSTGEMPKDAVHAGMAAAPREGVPGSKPSAMAPAAPGDGLTGKVLERLDASPYCYLRLKTAKGDVWAAVPEAKVEKGKTVTVVNPMLMTGFESKTLQRTFAEVYFGTLSSQGDSAPSAPAQGKANPHAGVAPMSSAIEVGKVEKASGPDARTVAEAWAQKTALKDKSVSIRGKVVKFNAGVLGKNWIHIQDGSGDPAKATHDLTVTCQDTLNKGDVVTVKGVLRLDKDFGAGYTYAVIIEDAKVTKN